MSNSDFVHLHVHTQYSLLDGACRIKELCKRASEYNMPALAMTDHGNMFGAIDFYSTAKSFGIKPIIGCETYVAMNGTRFDKSPEHRQVSHQVLLAKDIRGYNNLMRLVSAGSLEGFYYFPRIDKELIAKHSEGLIGTSSCLKGEVPQLLREGNYEAAKKAADEWQNIFGKGNYYLELMDHGVPEQRIVNEGLMKISKELNIPLIATNDVHYLTQDQATAHDALLCIQTQSTLNDAKRMRLSTDQFFLKSADQMSQLFSWAPDALKNTVEVAEKCNLELDFKTFHMPVIKPPDGLSIEGYLRKLCEEGFQKRYPNASQELRKRLDYELDIINKMGFPSYFLIVWDFIHFARSKGIPVGPGRGSAAGSMVSYLLGITNLDPIEYELLFERFLNPERSGMPDIDIDFCYERRGEVIDYVNEKYGQDHVAQIITFGTLQAKGAIRDVGRVMGVPYNEVDRISKLVPNDLGITISDALEKEPQLKELCENDAVANDIVSTARTLEGLNRHVSIHAAGVVIADKPLVEYVPLYKSSDGQITTAYSMNNCAKIGLLKMDFLGLRTLTVISEGLKLIKQHKNIEIDIDSLPLDDPKTYEMLCQGKSFGVFQLESGGMRELLKKLKPGDFEDIVSILALYRPGPMGSGMLDDFIKRKNGEMPIEYDHPKLESILEKTYGIILYQEQVMQIPVTLAGFTLAQADHLRRAMSKKIKEVMDKMRVEFVAGCQEHSGMTKEKANYLFDLIDYFSGYGFNRSHSAAYALITYQTAYLKANYPVEFMCALLNSEMHNTDKIVEYVKETSNMGIKVNLPNIHTGYKLFTVVDENTIEYGLMAVKNVGGSAIDSVVEQREKDGRYASIFDLCERVDQRLVNRKVLEGLIKSGAFDVFDVRRSQMMSVLEQAIELGAKAQKQKASGQMSFFDMPAQADGGFDKSEAQYPDIKEWDNHQILSFEKEALGFYASGHPLDHYQREIEQFADFSTKDLNLAHDGDDVKIFGQITHIKLTNTRRTGDRMAIIRVEDMDGEVEAVLFPKIYNKLLQYLNEGNVIFLNGKVNIREDRLSLIVNDIRNIQDVYSVIKSMSVDLGRCSKEMKEEFKRRLASSPGDVPVYIRLITDANKSVEIVVGKDYYIEPNDILISDLKELVGQDNVTMNI